MMGTPSRHAITPHSERQPGTVRQRPLGAVTVSTPLQVAKDCQQTSQLARLQQHASVQGLSRNPCISPGWDIASGHMV